MAFFIFICINLIRRKKNKIFAEIIVISHFICVQWRCSHLILQVLLLENKILMTEQSGYIMMMVTDVPPTLLSDTLSSFCKTIWAFVLLHIKNRCVKQIGFIFLRSVKCTFTDFFLLHWHHKHVVVSLNCQIKRSRCPEKLTNTGTETIIHIMGFIKT